MADLSNIIADHTAHGFDSDFPGIQTRTLSFGSYQRKPLDGCTGCVQFTSGNHKCWERIRVTPDGLSKYHITDYINDTNDLNERVRRTQSLIQLCDRTANGVANYNFNLGYGNNMSHALIYELVSASDGEVELLYKSGDQSPYKMEWNVFTPNPDWPGSGGYQTISQATAAMPMRGVLTFGSPSLLRTHHGLIAYQAEFSGGFTAGSTFTVKVHGDASNAGSTIDGTGSIFCTYRCYTVGEEGWTEPRDVYPFWGTFTEKEIQSGDWPGDYNFTIEASNRIWLPDTTWFACHKLVGAAYQNISSQAIGSTTISHVGSASWQTKCQLSAGTLAGASAVRFRYWIENTSSGAAKCTGQDRCAHAVADYTGTYGQSEGNITFYCENKETASKFDQFRPQCYQTDCSDFTRDSATEPLDTALWEQMTYDMPWKGEQLITGIADFRVSRKGPPSTGALSGYVRAADTPSGYHQIISFDLDSGGWPHATVSGTAIVYTYGLENLKSYTEEFGDTATWVAYGPGGNNWSKVLDIDQQALDDTNDPQRNGRSMILSSTIDVQPYDLTYSNAGDTGKHQRCGQTVIYQVFAPSLDGSAVQTGDGFKFTRGGWDADYQSVASGTVYNWHLELTKPILPDKTSENFWGGTVYTSLKVKAESYSGATLTLDLAHATVSASSQVSVQQERATKWMQGGQRVALRSGLRVRNWQSGAAGAIGPGRNRIYPGMVAFFESGEGFTGKCADRKFWITRATPCSGAALSWIPSPNEGGSNYWAPGSYFFPYNMATEGVSAVNVLRDDSVYGDNGIVMNYVGASIHKPYPNANESTPPDDLTKDDYWYNEGYDGATKGIYFYWSQLNATATDLDRIFYIGVETDDTTYGTVELNIVTDATDGFDNTLDHRISGVATITTIDAVTVTSQLQDSNGDNVIYTLSPRGSKPSPWSTWGVTAYYATGAGTGQTITIHSIWADDAVKIEFTMDSASGLGESTYYTHYIDIHSAGLPSDHEAEANKADQIFIRDENGALSDFIGGDTFVNKDIVVATTGIAHWEQPTLHTSYYNNAGADTKIDVSNYDWWGASGEAWGKTAANAAVTANNGCLITTCKMATREAWPLAASLDSARTTLERIIDE